MKRMLVVAAAILPLAACSWFGGSKTEEQAAAPAATPGLNSDQVLQRDCASAVVRKSLTAEVAPAELLA